MREPLLVEEILFYRWVCIVVFRFPPFMLAGAAQKLNEYRANREEFVQALKKRGLPEEFGRETWIDYVSRKGYKNIKNLTAEYLKLASISQST